MAGNFEQGIDHGREGLRLAEAMNSPVPLANMCLCLGQLYMTKGEPERAVSLFERGVALTQEWSLSYFSSAHAGWLGYAYAFLGRTAEGIPLIEQAAGDALRMGVRFAESLTLVQLGEACMLADRLPDALEVARRAATLARELAPS